MITAGETAVNMLSVYPIEHRVRRPVQPSVRGEPRPVRKRPRTRRLRPPREGDPRIAATFARISMRVDDSIELEDGPRLDIELTNGETLVVEAGNPTCLHVGPRRTR